MSLTINCRFQKIDPYGNKVFISSKQKEPESFEKLKTLYEKVKSMTDTFTPIYYNDTYEFCIVRFRNVKYTKLHEQATYKTTFTTRLVEKNEKKYINCFAQDIKFIKKPVVFALGVAIEI